MRVSTRHDGREMPFERDRRVVLRRLPSGAVVTRAVMRLSPYSIDPDGRFLETLTFPGARGDWGASKRNPNGAVEVDLRARRTLASLVGSNLAGPLLVDLGGGFLPVNGHGGLGGTPANLSGNTPDLPGLTVTGLRVVNAGADISVLRVASPPSNVTVAVDGGPTFFTHLGELVDPVNTPDFADLLQTMLPKLDVEQGSHVVPFMVHSDSIARLGLELDLDFTIAAAMTPTGAAGVQAPYRYGGTPAGEHGTLSVSVPPNLVAAPTGTQGRVQGAFESTRVVFGPLTTSAAPEDIPLAPSAPLAQPFVLPSTLVATSLDLFLTAATADVTLTVDLVGDLDGKPGSASLLAEPAHVTLTRDQAPAQTWVNVALPHEIELTARTRRWVMLQAREGSASWGAERAVSEDGADGPGLQQTRDGGLSWRMVTGAVTPSPLAGHLRLRHTTSTFHLPLELRVGSGEAEVAVPLQRFASPGRVDLDLCFAEVAEAVNTSLSAGRPAAVDGEHVANGTFADWYRIGVTLKGPHALQPEVPGDLTLDRAAVFHPDGRTAYVAGALGGSMRFLSFDVFCRTPSLDSSIGAGVPVAMVLDARGNRALVACFQFRSPELSARGLTGEVVLVDTSSGRPVGVPIPTEEPVFDLAVTSDGANVVLVGLTLVDDEVATSVRVVPWSALQAGTAGSAVDWADYPAGSLPGEPRALAMGSVGEVFVLTSSEGASSLHRYGDVTEVASMSTDAETLADAIGIAVRPSGDEVLVLGASVLRVVDTEDLQTKADITLGDAATRALAADPVGDSAFVVREEDVLNVDLDRRVVLPPSEVVVEGTSDGARMTLSPSGTHALVTRVGASDAALLTIGDALPTEWELTAGKVQPYCLPGTGEILALLGSPSLRSRHARAMSEHQAMVGAQEVSRRAQLSGPSTLSQVVPAAAGVRYRFTFDALTLVEGAVAELRWNGDGCALARVDRLPVTVFDPERRTTLDRIPAHEASVVAPAGATQVEVRFVVPEDLMVVDRVSLTGSGNVATSAWESAAASITATPSDTGVVVANGGAVVSNVSQAVPVVPGQRFDLQVRARPLADTPGAAVELDFVDELGATVGDVVRLALDPLDFDEHAAAGIVPEGAADGELRVVVPPGATVEVSALDLSAGETSEVALTFVSDAPGNLTMTDVAVQLDRPAAVPAPMPDSGLCRPSPPAKTSADACYCQSCGSDRPSRTTVPLVTDAGRPGRLDSCPSCRSPRVRLGGRPVTHAEPPPLPRFEVTDRQPARRGPAVVVLDRVDVPVADIDGIGPGRVRQLRKLGIVDMVGLSRAAVATVASLPGVSEQMARAFIAEASRIVRTRGQRVVFEP